MNAVKVVLMAVSAIVSQLPVFLLFKQSNFLPPFEGGIPLFILATEVIALAIFGLIYNSRGRIRRMSSTKLRSMVIKLLILFFSFGLSYFILLMNNVYAYQAQRIIAPMFPSSELSQYLIDSTDRLDVASIRDFIVESVYDTRMYYVTYVIFFIVYAGLYSSVVGIFALLGTRLSDIIVNEDGQP